MKQKHYYKSLKTLFRTAKRWTQGTAVCNNGKGYSYCLFGALHNVYRRDSSSYSQSYYEARRIIVEAIIKTSRGHYNDIVTWNDAPHRTFKQVRKLIESVKLPKAA